MSKSLSCTFESVRGGSCYGRWSSTRAGVRVPLARLLIALICTTQLLHPSMAAGDSSSNVPDTFFGTFKLERSENFDEFLASKGVNWFIRKMIQMTSVTKVFSKGTEPNRYNAINLSRKGNTEWLNWELGKTFEANGLDGGLHKITFGVQGTDTLTEHHIRLDTPNDKGETYYYTRDGDYLILRMSNDQVTTRRYFKSVPEGTS